ncbi:MFS general substrate transporter [Dissoconium aciculare CBS 342.82]|uniref:MFS general substrate transporter n=1 Tax=Dissoconium aciculare CBS 342.82 TaxID=1314786 RepID=A0A6J3M3H6_9PEZI|nr:MFS general substrate transporter [Dissoconium aciculare CBS 342.82]KAF1821482.1 MFS general substrate transporter [Dissoconium aciculare CBS 342.82]
MSLEQQHQDKAPRQSATFASSISDAESQIQDASQKPTKKQPQYLEGSEMIRAIIALNVANGVAFVDLMGVTALIARIGKDLQAGDTIAWAATSQLIGATIGMALLGYASDLWSRRRMLLIAQSILFFSAIACGVSRYAMSPAFFFLTRAMCGVATGSVSNLMNISLNDILPREKRNQWQGVQGCSIALGSILGMILGAVLVKTWQYLYFIESGLVACSIVLTYLWVPANCKPPAKDEIWNVLKTVDYFGILSGICFILPALVLICQGSDFDMRSGLFIFLVACSGISLIVFLVLGFTKRNVRPLIPFILFRNRTITAILLQNLLLGSAYYTFTYFLVFTLEVAHGYTPIQAAGLMSIYYVTHGFASTTSALLINALQRRGFKSYLFVFVGAFSTWTIANAMLAYTSSLTSLGSGFLGVLIILEIMVGLGTGSTFANGVLLLRANVTADLSAVSVGTRNVFRFMGGAIGTAISALILRSTLVAHLPDRLHHIADSAFSHPHLDLFSDEDADLILRGYAGATSTVFYVAAGFVGCCLLLCVLIKDDLGRPPPPETLTVPPTRQASIASNDDHSAVEHDEKDDEKDGLDVNEKDVDLFKSRESSICWAK